MSRPQIQEGKIVSVKISEHIQAQGTFVGWQDDKAVVRVDDDEIVGELINGDETATPCP